MTTLIQQITSRPANELDGTAAPQRWCWKTLFQTGILVAVSLMVVGVLWIRDTRSAAFTGAEDYVWENTCGEIQQDVVHRDDVVIEGRDMRGELGLTARRQSRVPTETVLPAVATRTVIIQGGLTGQLKDRDYGVDRQLCAAVMFELRYRRTVESSGEDRVVELREYGAVRTAKLLSPVESMKMAEASFASSQLDGLPFPGPGEGIAIAPVQDVSRAMLAKGAKEVVGNAASHAYVEEDLLSGKSLRLTYNGEGQLLAIEPIGWKITKPLAAYLFRHSIEHSAFLSQKQATAKYDLAMLASLLPPSLQPFGPARLQAETLQEASGKRYALKLVSEGVETQRGRRGRRRRAVSSFPRDDSGAPAQTLPIGFVAVDQSDTYIASAKLQWPLADLDTSPYSLLHEGAIDFQGNPMVSLCYECRDDSNVSE